MNDEAQIEFFKKLITINTVNGNELAEADYIKKVLADHHISARLVPFADGRANLVAEVGDNPGPVLALAGHIDTVDPGDPAKWTYDPFSATEKAGQIYGRGTVDMQSGLAAMVCALIDLKEAGLPKHGKARLLATVDEEVGGQGSMELTKQGFVHDVDAMVIGEATTGQIEYAHCGSFDYQVKSYGKLAHSSKPELGINAVTNLVKFINAEARAFDDAPESPVLGKLVHSITVFHGGDQLNSIPDYAFLKGNVRTVPECDNEATQQRLQAIIDRINSQTAGRLELSIVASFMPVVTDPNASFIGLAQEARQKVTGVAPRSVISHGATDASRYVLDDNKFPIIEFGPGVEELSHQVDEHVARTDVLNAEKTYVEIAKKFLI
ncbi:MAG: ArgE/DapE family deacylase [Lactobacillaceae bacterium]|nr:ArgE/DapE family deacylase [Lactobacillaceae bacterium]